MNKVIGLKNGHEKKPIHRIVRDVKDRFLGDGKNVPDENQLRVVLYSHDTMGVGHMRRNLLIASQISRTIPNASVLVVAGAKEANTFAQQAGIDCLTLPAYLKNSDGSYSTRNLGISANDVLQVRSNTILAAVKSYKPDLFIVDKVPAGAGGELLPTLQWLSEESSCHCVLGFRDILDSPATVQKDWADSGSNYILRKHYSSIWIYGDPDVYDSVTEYGFPEDIAQMASYTGYLNTESRLKDLSHLPYEIEVPYVLCTVGGGQDGEELATNFIDAIQMSPKNAVLLTGPYMPPDAAERLQRRAENIPKLKIVEFVDEGDLLVRNASHVVSMGGYNTVAAILSHQKTSLIVPRCDLRQEQLIRANCLSNKGLVAVKRPDEISPKFISNWLTSAAKPDYSSANLNMDGLVRITKILESRFPSILASQPTTKVASNGKH